MVGKWAYVTCGKLKNHDKWDWYSPLTRNRSDPLLWNMLGGYGGGHPPPKVMAHGTNVIGFDGKKWVAGFMACPSAVLDSSVYPPEHYSFDNVKRRIQWIHGCMSETSAFPEVIPLVDSFRFKELHETHAVPLFRTSIENESSGAFHNIPKGGRVTTMFETVSSTVTLADHLPPDAIERLRIAHASGKPISIHYDSMAKEWVIPPTFEKDFLRAAKQQKELPKATMPQTAAASEFATPAPSILEKTASETVDSLKLGKVTAGQSVVGNSAGEVASAKASFSKLPLSGRLAIIGGTALVGGIIGFWAYSIIQQRRNNHQHEAQSNNRP